MHFHYVLKNMVLPIFFFSLLGYEGLEVINPEGGTEDAEVEAQRGRWKQEVTISLLSPSFSCHTLFWYLSMSYGE